MHKTQTQQNPIKQLDNHQPYPENNLNRNETNTSNLKRGENRKLRPSSARSAITAAASAISGRTLKTKKKQKKTIINHLLNLQFKIKNILINY